MEAFAKRKIDVRILANKGTNAQQEIVLNGLRCSATVTMQALAVQGELQLSIWGMTMERMDSLTIFGPIMQERRFNEIMVTAGTEDDAELALLYTGVIDQAYADMNRAPNVRFSIHAMSAAADQVHVINARAHNGARDAAEILKSLAEEMGKQFENHGVSVMLRDRTYTGTAWSQATEVARDANICMVIEKNTLAIWPRDGSRSNEPILVSPTTGMVGYPSFAGDGIMLTMLFNPNIGTGDTVQVESDMKVACGLWTVTNITHQLDSEIPGGAWFTHVATYGRPLK